MDSSRKQEFILLVLITVLSLAMGLYFGNKIVVEEGFISINRVRDGLKNAKTLRDVKTEYVRVINGVNKAKDRAVDVVKKGVLEKFGLIA